MANTILTDDIITKEALAILHEELSFIGKINRQYDSSFSGSGAKIGDSLRIRKPARYTVRDGSALSVQNHTEENITLTVNTQKGVDVEFSSVELTLELEEFSRTVLRPQMAILASAIEADALSMINDVGNSIYTGSDLTFKDVLKAKARLDQQTTPEGERCMLIDPITEINIVDEVKGLFQSSNQINNQYLKGSIGTTAGFDWYESNRMETVVNGSDVTTITTVGASTNGDTTIALAGLGLTETYAAGMVFTVASIKGVHPETKKVYGYNYQFTLASDMTTDGSGNGTAVIQEAIYGTTARQNLSALPANTDAVTFLGAASQSASQNLSFHKDAFTFATADLVMPKGVDMASRQVFEGISMRMVRAYDISTDTFPCRFDVLYGFKTLRPEYACRLIEPFA